MFVRRELVTKEALKGRDVGVHYTNEALKGRGPKALTEGGTERKGC